MSEENKDNEYRASVRDALKNTQSSLVELSRELQESRLSDERVIMQLTNAMTELDRARNERATMEQRLTRLEALLTGAAGQNSTWAVWIGVAAGVLGTIIGGIVALVKK